MAQELRRRIDEAEIELRSVWRQLPITLHPTFDGLLSTVLLVVSMLRPDEFRVESNDVLFARRDQYGRQHHV